MKCLLCFLALALPGISLAAIDAAQVTELKAGIIERSENPPQHHPVIEVKFVLTRAHQDTQSLPQIDLGVVEYRARRASSRHLCEPQHVLVHRLGMQDQFVLSRGGHTHAAADGRRPE
jgi:hypothetical protein